MTKVSFIVVGMGYFSRQVAKIGQKSKRFHKKVPNFTLCGLLFRNEFRTQAKILPNIFRNFIRFFHWIWKRLQLGLDLLESVDVSWLFLEKFPISIARHLYDKIRNDLSLNLIHTLKITSCRIIVEKSKNPSSKFFMSRRCNLQNFPVLVFWASKSEWLELLLLPSLISDR